MAITISGQNNNDKIVASDGVLDMLSGFNVVGVMTANSFDVGSNIKLGNAGIITATTVVGNVTGNLTGNINHTSNLLLQISGSEKFRVGTSGQFGIAGANYGTSGQVLTSGGSGSAPTWSTITGTTINNNADNRIITGSGTANTLNGEANFTFDGTNLVLAEGVEVKLGTSSNLEIISIQGNKARIQSQQEQLNIETAASKSIVFRTNRNGTNAGWNINTDGDWIPSADSTVDIGTNTVRVQNIYADTLYGNGSNLTGITGTTINNNADNRVITGSGTANTLNGESGLTFSNDGVFSVTCASNYNAYHKFINPSGLNQSLTFEGPAGTQRGLLAIAGGSGSFSPKSITNDVVLRSEANIVFDHRGSNIIFTKQNDERLRITSDGKIGMKTASPQKDLHVYNSSVSTVRIETGDSRGQAWDILSTNGSQNNTGTLSFRNEAGNSFLDLSSNEGAHKTVFRNGGGSDLLVIDKSGNANIVGVCTANTFKGILVPTTYAGGRRNMFINGEFMINQRGTRNPMGNRDNGANGLGYGGPDHVQFVTNLGAFDAKQANENNSPRSQAGATYSYELDCTSASGPSTSNYTFLKFKWSGIEANRLLYGTSNARPVTISFWVQCNKTGNFTATLRNETANKLISKVVTISSSNTWEYKTITFVGDTAAQIAVTQGDRWNLELWLDGGSNYTGGTVRTGWSGMNNADRGAGSTLNICSSTSNYFRISLFQVEMGPNATPFEFRTYTEYLKDCEYYFQRPVQQPFAIHIWGHKVADTYALRAQTMLRPTEMRVNPTDYYHDDDSTKHAQRFQTQGSDYEYTYNVAMGIGSNRREFSNGTKYPYGVNGISSAESGILWAFDYESYAEY